MTNKNYTNILSSLMDQYQHDILMTVTLSLLWIVTLAILAVSGTAIWPILISLLAVPAAAPFIPLMRMLLLINIGLLALYGVAAALMKLLGQSSPFTKLVTFNFSCGMLVNLLYLFSQNGAIEIASQLNVLMTPLWFIVSFFLSCMLAFMPAVLAAAVSKLVCAVLSILK